MTQEEVSLVLVKPDGVKRRLIGEVISRLERKGLRVVGLKMLTMCPRQVKLHYAQHIGKDFYNALQAFTLSGPVVAIVVAGTDCETIRKVAMDIRSDLSCHVRENVVHASDDRDRARTEIMNIFADDELAQIRSLIEHGN